MEHEIPFGNSNRENGTTFFDFPLFMGIFQWDEPTKRVPFTAKPEIPEILTKWKALLVSLFRFKLYLGKHWSHLKSRLYLSKTFVMGDLHLVKKTGNFGGRKSGISDWQKVVPFGRKPRYVVVPGRGPGTGTNYKKRKWNTTFSSEIPTGKTGPPF